MDYRKVFNTLVDETIEYLKRNNLKAMVLGISGGIDSTVVAAICNEVSKQTGIPLIGRSLPIKNKGDEFEVSKLVGKAFCNDFGIANLHNEYREILSGIVWREECIDILDKTNTIMSPEKSKKQTPIANGNIQARLRMIYLYNLAGIHQGLVMDTDNMTEHMLGFWTIHGDEGDFNPIGGLWKSEVYELAKWLLGEYNSKTGMFDDDPYNKAEALEQSIGLTPTDGLGISNSDLEQIGANSYAEVDEILQGYISFLHNNDHSMIKSEAVQEYIDLYDGLIDKEIVTKVMTRNLNSEFKRKHRPIVIPRERYTESEVYKVVITNENEKWIFHYDKNGKYRTSHLACYCETDYYVAGKGFICFDEEIIDIYFASPEDIIKLNEALKRSELK